MSFFKYIKILLLYAIILVGIHQKVIAQEPYYSKINYEPTDIVFDLHQDSKGFMWLATNKGLYRYDGFEYKLYRSDVMTSVSGSNIQEDFYGRIWYENFDGYLYYIQNNVIHHLKQKKPAGFISYGISNKYIVVLSQKSIEVYDIKTLKHLKSVEIPIDRIESAVMHNNQFYVISDHIIYKMDEECNVTTSDFFVNYQYDIKNIYSFNDSYLYIISKFNEEEKLFIFDSNLVLNRIIPTPGISLIQGSSVVDGLIWLHTNEGSYTYNIFKKDYKTSVILKEKNVTGLVKDFQSNYWFSTLNDGIINVPDLNTNIYDIKSNGFLKFTKVPKGFLISTAKGEIIKTNDNFTSYKTIYYSKQRIQNYYLYYDYFDDNIFFSSSGFSVVPNGNFNLLKNYNAALKETVRLDSKYYAVVISGFVGLLKNPAVSKTEKSIWDKQFNENIDRNKPEFARLINGVRGKSVDYNTKEQSWLVATNLGTYKISVDSIQEIKFQNKTLYSEKIVCINDQYFILDTKGNLYQYDSVGQFSKINGQKNIPDTFIRSIKKNDSELLIVGMDNIYTYDISRNIVKVIPFKIEAHHINDLIKEKFHIVVLTDEKIIRIPLFSDKILKNIPFTINNLKVNHVDYNWDNKLELDYFQNSIEINFSVLNYSNKHVPFYYRLNGQNWIEIHKDTRNITFPSLEAGEYLVEFKIGDSIIKDAIAFKINLPFWKVWWYYLILGSAIVGMIYFYFIRKNRLLRKQYRLLNEKIILEKNLSKSTMAAIKSQMNPHFFYNALNTIQAYIFTNDKVKANSYLAKFSKLTRLILEMSEQETVSLGEEIEALNIYLELEKMRFSDHFNYEFIIQNTSNLDAIELPPMLIQPYVENAIKHGLLHKFGEKILTIKMIENDDYLLVTIDDNGVGRINSKAINKIKSDKHQSFSSGANQRRLEILNQGKSQKVVLSIIDKVSESGESLGTTVQLNIPIK